MAVRGHLGLGQDLGQLAAEHGHVGDGRGMRRVRVQPEEPVLPDDGVVRPEFLDRDVVQVAGPVDRGPGVGLGQHQALGRVLRAARDLGRHLADRLLARLGVAQDAEAGAGHGAQPGAVGGPDQVVLAVAEEEEVAVGQPAEQIAVLGPVAAWLCPSLAAQICGQAAGHRAHPRLVFHRDPHVVEHVPEFGREPIRGHLVPGRAELHVDPGFGDLAGFGLARNIGRGIGAHAEDPAQRAGHVPAHPQHRMHQQPDLGLVPVQLGGDRVDQVGHVVDDDVDDQAGPADRVQLGVRGLADLDQGPPLRPGQAEPGVRLGHRRQPRRRSQVLGGDALVIGVQVARDAVLPAVAVAYRLRAERRVVLPGLRRLGEQGFPGLVLETVRHRVHSLVSVLACGLFSLEPAVVPEHVRLGQRVRVGRPLRIGAVQDLTHRHLELLTG